MNTKVLLAIGIGLLFGVALNRVGATNPQNIINMLRLKDLRLLKTIVFAIGLSSVLLFGGVALGLIDPGHLSVKSAYVGVLVGGAIFGIGFAIAGFCPGTSLASAATGRIDAVFFIIGGLVGAFAYMLSYGLIKQTFLLDKLAGGKTTLVVTGNGKFNALLSSLPGPELAALIGLALLVIAWVMPTRSQPVHDA